MALSKLLGSGLPFSKKCGFHFLEKGTGGVEDLIQRVAAALQMYLDYIFTIMAELEPEVANFASNRAETIWKEAKEYNGLVGAAGGAGSKREAQVTGVAVAGRFQPPGGDDRIQELRFNILPGGNHGKYG